MKRERESLRAYTPSSAKHISKQPRLTDERNFFALPTSHSRVHLNKARANAQPYQHRSKEERLARNLQLSNRAKLLLKILTPSQRQAIIDEYIRNTKSAFMDQTVPSSFDPNPIPHTGYQQSSHTVPGELRTLPTPLMLDEQAMKYYTEGYFGVQYKRGSEDQGEQSNAKRIEDNEIVGEIEEKFNNFSWVTSFEEERLQHYIDHGLIQQGGPSTSNTRASEIPLVGNKDQGGSSQNHGLTQPSLPQQSPTLYEFLEILQTNRAFLQFMIAGLSSKQAEALLEITQEKTNPRVQNPKGAYPNPELSSSPRDPKTENTTMYEPHLNPILENLHEDTVPPTTTTEPSKEQENVENRLDPSWPYRTNIHMERQTPQPTPSVDDPSLRVIDTTTQSKVATLILSTAASLAPLQNTTHVHTDVTESGQAITGPLDRHSDIPITRASEIPLIGRLANRDAGPSNTGSNIPVTRASESPLFGERPAPLTSTPFSLFGDDKSETSIFELESNLESIHFDTSDETPNFGMQASGGMSSGVEGMSSGEGMSSVTPKSVRKRKKSYMVSNYAPIGVRVLV